MKKLALVGASGLVGQTVLKVLKEEGLIEKFELFLISSNRSAGKILVFDDKHYILHELCDDVLKEKFDYAIFVLNEDVSNVWVKKFAKNGTTIIDNSSVFRMNKNVPLIVPEINFNIIKKSDKIIANPNCSTIQLVLVLDRLKKLADFESVVVSSYQSVSGAGKEALLDLETGSNNVFDMGIKDNFIAQIGKCAENKFCSEENKIMLESQKILKDKFNISEDLTENNINNRDKIPDIVKNELNEEYSPLEEDIEKYRLDAINDTTKSIEYLPRRLICEFLDTINQLTVIKQQTSCEIETVSKKSHICLITKSYGFQWIKFDSEIL